MTSWNSNLFEFEWEGEGGECLFKAWCLLTFSAFIMSALIFKVGANSGLGTYSSKYGS